jgi:peptidoglycan DL-endopeptidase CwlO
MPAVFAAGVGALVIWSGLKGASVSGGFRSLLTGQKPSGLNVHPIDGPVTGVQPGPVISGSTGNAIADDALRYQGTGYQWGGKPAFGINSHDCSSLDNWVVGHDLGMAIPGFRAGSYTGTTHGPTTMLWAIWPGAKTIPRSEVRAGDLCIWPAFHMGIAVSNSRMISALNPSKGTQVTGIDGTAGGPLVCRRLR